MSFINLEEIGFKDNYSLDAFHRLRTSEVVTLFDSQSQYGLGAREWSFLASGSGTQTSLPDESSVELSTGGITSGNSAIRQTRLCWRYQSGKSQLYFQTFLFGTSATNVVRRIGYFNSDDGIFLEQNDTDLRLVLRSSISGSPSDALFATQANWNLDRLDGTGSSGKTLDITKTQLMFIDLQWLGVGRVRVGFFIDGIPILVHEFDRGNILTTAYMKSANLPARGEISNNGTAVGTSTLKMVCTSIMTEGGDESFSRGHLNASSNGISTIAVTARRPVLSIRPAATFMGVTNYAWYIPIEAIIHTDSDIYWEVVFASTLTGSSWSSAASDSCVEVDTSATSLSGGTRVINGFTVSGVGSSSGSSIAEIAGRFPNSVGSLNGEQLSHTLVATSFSGTANVSVAVNWREIY